MEFKSLKNIETSFRQIRLFGIVFLCLCALVSVFSVVASFRFAEKQREKIYVLDGGKSLMLALSQDLSQNRPVEAREHIRRFHELFLAMTYARQMIVRESNITERSLVTRCELINSGRSDNNPQGFIMEKFEILENRDLRTLKR